MRHERARSDARRGFTLVELLVVIAIIGILMSLLLAAVMKTLGRAEEAQARNDISQLAHAIESFKIKYGVDYIPSRIVLKEDLTTYNLNNQLDKDSIEYLRRVWPRLGQGSANNKINWNGDGSIGGAFTLWGDQCLVFFLGGIPDNSPSNNPYTPHCLGFSTDPTNPAKPGGDRNTFFDFPSNRLIPTTGFYSFKDPYGKAGANRTNTRVYAYFSAYKTANGYNRYFGLDGKSDCDGLSPQGLWPYAEAIVGSFPGGRYVNPNTYQIICAGQDGQYGTGTHPPANPPVWTPKNPGTFSSPPAFDDMTNFHDRLLGVPAN